MDPMKVFLLILYIVSACVVGLLVWADARDDPEHTFAETVRDLALTFVPVVNTVVMALIVVTIMITPHESNE